MNDVFVVAHALVTLVTAGLSVAAIVISRQSIRELEADNVRLAARRDELKAEKTTAPGRRLLTDLERVQTERFGVPMKRVPRVRRPHLVEWDAIDSVPDGLELVQPTRPMKRRD